MENLNKESLDLNEITNGAFNVEGQERVKLINEWIETNPSDDNLILVWRELKTVDNLLAEVVQAKISASAWLIERANNLLRENNFRIHSALVWLKDLKKLGFNSEEEPFLITKNQIKEKIKSVENLQNLIQDACNSGAILFHRLDELSLKPWQEIQDSEDLKNLETEIQTWQIEVKNLKDNQDRLIIEKKISKHFIFFVKGLDWLLKKLKGELENTKLASENSEAELPKVTTWANEISVLRGLNPELEVESLAKTLKLINSFEQEIKKKEAEELEKIQKRKKAIESLNLAVENLKSAFENENPKQVRKEAVAKMKEILKESGGLLDLETSEIVHGYLLKGGDKIGWNPKQITSDRENLIKQANELLKKIISDKETYANKDALQQIMALHKEWKKISDYAPIHYYSHQKFKTTTDKIWKTVNKIIEENKEKAEREAKQNRLDLIKEVKIWSEKNKDAKKANLSEVMNFGIRWKNAGKMSNEVDFLELKIAWKNIFRKYEFLLKEVEFEAKTRRESLIKEAKKLTLNTRISLIKDLKNRYQEEQQKFRFSQKEESEMWNEFNHPLKKIFDYKEEQQKKFEASLSDHEREILDKSKQLEKILKNQDVAEIKQKMSDLEELVNKKIEKSEEKKSEEKSKENAETKPLVAVRGDDRPTLGAKPKLTLGKKTLKLGGNKNSAESRLNSVVFAKQREALEAAKEVLRKIASLAQDEKLDQLFLAWKERSPESFPADLKLPNSTVDLFKKAIASQSLKTALDDLLKLEIIADIKTPQAYLSRRSEIQLKFLTQKNSKQNLNNNWEELVANILICLHNPENEQRLKKVLKRLIK